MKQKKTTQQFINEAIEVHGFDKYDYSEVNYINYDTKIMIICNICKQNKSSDGKFEQKAGDHLKGRGCIKNADTKLLLIKIEKQHNNLLLKVFNYMAKEQIGMIKYVM